MLCDELCFFPEPLPTYELEDIPAVGVQLKEYSSLMSTTLLRIWPIHKLFSFFSYLVSLFFSYTSDGGAWMIKNYCHYTIFGLWCVDFFIRLLYYLFTYSNMVFFKWFMLWLLCNLCSCSPFELAPSFWNFSNWYGSIHGLEYRQGSGLGLSGFSPASACLTLLNEGTLYRVMLTLSLLYVP